MSLIGISGLISLATVLAYPLPTCDETSYASAALAITVTDASAPLSYSQGMPGANGLAAIVSFGRKISTYNLALAGVLRVAGVSLIAARLFAWCGWLAAAALTYGLGRKLHSQTVGLIGALLFMTSTKAYLTGHTARPEIWVTAAVLAGMIGAYAVMAAEKPLRWWVIVGAGAISVWAGEIHLQGTLFTAGIGAAVFIEVGIRQRRWRDFWWFAAGVALGIGVWVALLAASGFGFDDVIRLGRFASPVPNTTAESASESRWVRNLRTLPEWFALIFWGSGGPIAALEALFGLLGIGYAIWKRDRAGLYLAGVGLIAIGLFGIAHRNRWVQYGVVWSPLWYLIGTMAITRIKRHEWAVIGLAAAHIMGMGWLGWQYRDGTAAYVATGAALREALPADVSVAADPIWWWHLNDRAYLSDEYFSYILDTDRAEIQEYMGLTSEIGEEEAAAMMFEQIAPDYFVIDGALACNSGADRRYELMQSIVETRCELVQVIGADLDTPLSMNSLGQVNAVYRCGK